MNYWIQMNNVDLKTEISKDYATMLTIGATANKYIIGEEATAFSKFNDGLINRYEDNLEQTTGNNKNAEQKTPLFSPKTPKKRFRNFCEE